ncbi:MAG TPA: hypothetical protein VE223_03880 [Nitrososphaeraceae archaeon]|jgi:hypothetical protein|nr:hypothetical protein [Nitrososphaeraceae archaeon]
MPLRKIKVIAIMATSGLLLSTGALTALYSQNAFAQVFNTGSANVEICEAGRTLCGTSIYNSNGGFVLGGSVLSGAGGG